MALAVGAAVARNLRAGGFFFRSPESRVIFVVTGICTWFQHVSTLIVSFFFVCIAYIPQGRRRNIFFGCSPLWDPVLPNSNIVPNVLPLMTDREAKEINKINKKLSHGIPHFGNSNLPILVTPTYPPWLDLMDPEMGQK